MCGKTLNDSIKRRYLCMRILQLVNNKFTIKSFKFYKVKTSCTLLSISPNNRHLDLILLTL